MGVKLVHATLDIELTAYGLDVELRSSPSSGHPHFPDGVQTKSPSAEKKSGKESSRIIAELPEIASLSESSGSHFYMASYTFHAWPRSTATGGIHSLTPFYWEGELIPFLERGIVHFVSDDRILDFQEIAADP